ncbi:hypothetical protein GQ600_26605 [Phytophthora cactorum]|nr:hypothetical protein GQ600_26605 [Phytophthora cactorum]
MYCNKNTRVESGSTRGTGSNTSIIQQNEELDATVLQLEALSQEERENSARATTEKVAALEKLVEEKTMAVKKADRQLNAAKLLARQAKRRKKIYRFVFPSSKQIWLDAHELQEYFSNGNVT